MAPHSLELQIQSLPENPGVYQYYDKEGKILYVGKAKNLKKRVQSYFTKQHDNYKTSILVKKIVQIKHIVVPTETDALLLENNLIKKYILAITEISVIIPKDLQDYVAYS